MSSVSLTEMYKGFIRDLIVVSIEDHFDKDDGSGDAKLMKETDIEMGEEDMIVTTAIEVTESIEIFDTQWTFLL